MWVRVNLRVKLFSIAGEWSRNVSSLETPRKALLEGRWGRQWDLAGFSLLLKGFQGIETLGHSKSVLSDFRSYPVIKDEKWKKEAVRDRDCSTDWGLSELCEKEWHHCACMFRSGPPLIPVSKEAPSVHLLIKTASPEKNAETTQSRTFITRVTQPTL